MPPGSSNSAAITIDLPDEAATAALARGIAPWLKVGDVVALWGDLGAGKTAFARTLIRTLIGAEAEVPSPTFTLVQTYDAPFGRISHFDLYRIAHPDELTEIGWDEALADGVTLVEWPGRAGTLLRPFRIDLELAFGASPGARRGTLRLPDGRDGNAALLAALQRAAGGE